ncbi:D-alanine--D-alanine ligase [Hufsiella ginkgonis]|uniref:D-alanine--D-alanine ligase n=1 Tax=Hufsiella ginkgonis TaxID=2695274 RepID=A0A7K1XZX7_9SPHI|nr:D-alanine--D-alanine ligase [Hufsiella ginkgonis]MXV16571.1 D-alanine--D-alanine ligase [Hufsiella ginkgonis]
MAPKNIALMAGGFTGEFEVSINSARNIAASLDPAKYNVYTLVVTTGNWYYEIPGGIAVEVNKNDFSLMLDGEKVTFDAAFITIHGTPGEDGKLQAYFDILGIPYTTCDTSTSAVTMNKAFTKAVVRDVPGLYTARSARFYKNDGDPVTGIMDQHLQFPLFIKPNNGGSSVGMSKVNDAGELPAALGKAFREDDDVLVEEFISGREFSIGLYRFHGEIFVLPPTEIISSKDFFDYEAKYTPGMSREITPAALEPAQLDRVRKIVRQAYHVLNCKGMSRVDFILQEHTGNFYFIEINTTPGQSAASIYPQQVRAAGMDIGEFYGELIEEALRGGDK